MGGLGNQLFQIFAVISYSMRQNCEFIFEYSTQLHTGIVRYTFWDSFLKALLPYTSANKQHDLITSYIPKFPMYKENAYHYTNIPDNLNSEYVSLFGYFQSYKYFEKHWDEIKKMILLEQQQHDVLNQYKSIMEREHVISMHFRLGDYKTKQQYHPVMPYEYYLKSLQYICDSGSSSKQVLFFCEKEDNQTVSSMIQKMQNVFPDILFTKADDEIPDWKQMLLMSCCQSNIVANSSFSWWGAYMNNQDVCVCYPSVWFGPAAHNDTKDLFPETWHKIDIRC
jgi:hypothetical protein